MSASAPLPLLALLLAAFVALASSGTSHAADAPAKWWIEIVRERAVPTGLAQKRAEAKQRQREKEEKEAEEKAAAEAKEAKAAADDAEAAAGDEKIDAEGEVAADEAPKAAVKERVKAMLEKLPALPDADGDAEEKPDVGADDTDKDAGEEKEAEDAVAVAAVAVADEAVGDEEVAEEADALTLTVAMAGEIVSLDQKSLVFRPTFDADRELVLPLKQVTSLSRYAPQRKPADDVEGPELEFRVLLRDGSEVPGQLIALTEKAITVSLVGSGAKIDLPLGQITRVERDEPIGGAVDSPLFEATDRHVAALSTGEIISGQLLPSRDSEKWLRLASPILTAETPLSLIDLLVFPEPQTAPGGAEALLAADLPPDDEPTGNNGDSPPARPVSPDAPPEEPPTESEPDEPEVHHLVSLSPAGLLWASDLKLHEDRLVISALGNDGFTVPIERVESVSFGHETLGATAPVLVWGGYSDEDDEYQKTLDALEERIPSRKLLQNMSKMPDAEFMRLLRRARVLLVPEMESFRKDNLEAAAAKAGRGVPSWGEAFRGFLRRGGNIVFLSPTGDALNFFNDSGLGPLRSGGSGDSWRITDAGRKIGAKIDGDVENVNATHYYRKGAPWEAWGEAADGNDGVTLVGRRLERGWVMTFGADFYETNDEVTETLVRLLEFRGRR